MRQRKKHAAEVGWTAGLPPELMRSAPRPVRLTLAGRVLAGIALLLSLAAPVAGVFLYDAAQRDRARLERMRREAVAAEAEVIQTGFTRDQQRRRWILYQYRVGDRLYRGRVTLRRGPVQGVEPGSRLKIGYLPEEPSRSWLPGREPSGLPVWVALVVPLSVWSSAPWLAWAIRRQWRLLAEGRAALGSVTRIERVRGTGGVSRLHYEFPLLSGARGAGFFDSSSRRVPAAGAPVVVVYDPDNPRRNARYPFSLVRPESTIG